MRAGRLFNRIDIFDGATKLFSCWSEIDESKEQHQTSLKMAQTTRFAVRFRADVKRGQYIRFADRLFYIEGVSSLSVDRKKTHINCTELSGQSGVYQRHGGSSYPVIVFVGQNTPYIGVNGDLLDYLHRVEIPVVEFQPPYRHGDKILVNGTTFTLRGIAEGGDDGVVVQFMA